MHPQLASIRSRWENDASFRFDFAVVATFCASSIWWIPLLFSLPTAHAWRWIANHLTFGFWHTFLMPLAVGILCGTLRFDRWSGFDKKSRRQWQLVIGAIILLPVAPVLLAFSESKVEPYMLHDQKYLDTESVLRSAHWRDVTHSHWSEEEVAALNTYREAVIGWRLSELSPRALLNPLASWIFIVLVGCYLLFSFHAVLRTTKAGYEHPIGMIAFGAALITAWFPLRDYADWYNHYFLGPRTVEINHASFLLFCIAISFWVWLGAVFIGRRKAKVSQNQGNANGVLPVSEANGLIVLILLVILLLQIVPSPPNLDEAYHWLEVRLPDERWALAFIVGVAFVFAPVYLTVRDQFTASPSRPLNSETSSGGEERHADQPALDGAQESDGIDKATATSVAKLSNAPRLAYRSFQYACQQEGRLLSDKEAWNLLREKGMPEDDDSFGDLAGYELQQEFESWTRQLRIARKALNEQKNRPRGQRGNSGSVVRQDNL